MASADTLEMGDARFLSYTVPVESAAVAAGDFDGDGRADLVGAGETHLTIFRSDSDGKLTSAGHVPGGEDPNDFALADLDGDGDTDIVVANHETDYLTLLLGDGRGAFEPASNSPLRINVRPHPHAVRAADFNADGLIDLAVDHREAGGLLVLQGLGGSQFDAPGIVADAGGDPYWGMAVGDLDGDGRPDVVTPNPDEVGVLINVSGDEIAFNRATPVPAMSPFAVGLGDLNDDGHLDLIAAPGQGSPVAQLFLGDGTGEFEEFDGSPFRAGSGAKRIVVGDFNGDGADDAAIASYESSDVLILLGGDATIRTAYVPGGEHPWGMAVSDLNRDGRDDLVITDDAAQQASVYVSVPSRPAP